MAALEGLTETTFTFDGVSRPVYRAGSGPGVVVVHEIPGITPLVAEFGRRVVDAGFTVALPSLVGEPGRPMSGTYVMRSFTQVCISKEFASWALNRTSPVIAWLRALARDLHAQAGGPGVGAVGMCFSGGFALAMAVDDEMLAPVLSQPSMPFPVGKARSKALGLSDADLARVKDRVAHNDLCVLGLRFSKDRAVPDARWARYRQELGDNFIAVDIDSSPGNPHGIKKAAHSVLTEELVDQPGHPTKDALDRVLAFLRDRLMD
ncbi:MAG: dienelactone hydrolase family protein [Acidimicrobiia bacterium]